MEHVISSLMCQIKQCTIGHDGKPPQYETGQISMVLRESNTIYSVKIKYRGFKNVNLAKFMLRAGKPSKCIIVIPLVTMVAMVIPLVTLVARRHNDPQTAFIDSNVGD